MHDPVNWDESLLARYSADMRQFVGARDITLNGMRALHLYNAAGLELIVLPDRGFDIWDARFKGLPLTWLAPGSPFPPDWGADGLRQFNGGLLTTCGLTHVGPPEIDDLTGEKSGIHGNYTRLRAGPVQIAPLGTDAVESRSQLQLRATVHESPCLALKPFLSASIRLVWRSPPSLSATPSPTSVTRPCR